MISPVGFGLQNPAVCLKLEIAYKLLVHPFKMFSYMWKLEKNGKGMVVNDCGVTVSCH